MQIICQILELRFEITEFLFYSNVIWNEKQIVGTFYACMWVEIKYL